jgi:hypothetical protein
MHLQEVEMIIMEAFSDVITCSINISVELPASRDEQEAEVSTLRL